MSRISEIFSKIKSALSLLDPFTYVDNYVSPVVNPNNNKWIGLAVDFVFALLFAFVIYNFILPPILGTSVPIVIVFSGSMEPTLYRGDVVVLSSVDSISSINSAVVDFPVKGKFLSEYADVGYSNVNGVLRASALKIGGREYPFSSRYPYENEGSIVVYHSSAINQDIIHRAVLKIKAPDGEFVITQGDNIATNNYPDQLCSAFMISANKCISPYAVPVSDLRGKYLFHLPLIGYVKLLLFDDLPRLVFG